MQSNLLNPIKQRQSDLDFYSFIGLAPLHQFEMNNRKDFLSSVYIQSLKKQHIVELYDLPVLLIWKQIQQLKQSKYREINMSEVVLLNKDLIGLGSGL